FRELAGSAAHRQCRPGRSAEMRGPCPSAVPAAAIHSSRSGGPHSILPGEYATYRHGQSDLLSQPEHLIAVSEQQPGTWAACRSGQIHVLPSEPLDPPVSGALVQSTCTILSKVFLYRACSLSWI